MPKELEEFTRTSGRYTYTSVERVFAMFIRDTGQTTFDEGDVIEWIGEALAFIGTPQSREEAIAFAEVKNHQVDLPNGIIGKPMQIAKNRCWGGPEDGFAPKDVMCQFEKYNDFLVNSGGHTPDIPLPIDCTGKPLQAYDLAYYRPYYDLQSEYYTWSQTAMYRSCFEPCTLATGTFGTYLEEALEKINGGAPTANSRYHHGDNWEYQIVGKGTAVRFNFRIGHVAIAYERVPVDPATGYPLVPDTIEHTTACVKYVMYKMTLRDMFNHRDGAIGISKKFEEDWQWYCKQAINKDMMIQGLDEHENWYNQRTRLLPHFRDFYTYFGKMSKPESRRFDDPDRRNYSLGYFRGNTR